MRKAYDVAANDRMDLEGKVINYKFEDGNADVMVVGCNRAVGITLVSHDVHKTKHLCMRGPVCPDPSENSDWVVSWDEVYDTTVGMIEDGELDAAALIEYMYGESFTGRCDGRCAYSQ